MCAKGCGREASKQGDRYCRECRNAYNREWRRTNRDKKRVSDGKWLAAQKASGGCRKCAKPACKFSISLCLLHYLARRAKYALGKETVANARLLMEAFERQDGRCPLQKPGSPAPVRR